MDIRQELLQIHNGCLGDKYYFEDDNYLGGGGSGAVYKVKQAYILT